jgi:hypothetical protein
MFITIAVAAVIAVAGAPIAGAPSFRSPSTVAEILALLAFLAFPIWGSPRLAARTQYRKQPSAHSPRTVAFDSTGIRWRWDGGTADWDWKNITGVSEDKKVVLLYTSPNAFNMLPKRALTSEQLSELHLLLDEHVFKLELQ